MSLEDLIRHTMANLPKNSEIAIEIQKGGAKVAHYNLVDANGFMSEEWEEVIDQIETILDGLETRPNKL